MESDIRLEALRIAMQITTAHKKTNIAKILISKLINYSSQLISLKDL